MTAVWPGPGAWSSSTGGRTPDSSPRKGSATADCSAILRCTPRSSVSSVPSVGWARAQPSRAPGRPHRSVGTTTRGPPPGGGGVRTVGQVEHQAEARTRVGGEPRRARPDARWPPRRWRSRRPPARGYAGAARGSAGTRSRPPGGCWRTAPAPSAARADGVVTTGPLLLECPQAELVAVVDARHPWEETEQGHSVGQVAPVADLAGDPGHVMVAQEGHRDQVLEQGAVPAQRPVQRVQVDAVQGGPDGVPQLVLAVMSIRTSRRSPA